MCIEHFDALCCLGSKECSEINGDFPETIRIATLADQFIALFIEQLDQDAAFHIVQFDFCFLHNGTS